MSLGIICCRVLEKEINAVTRNVPEVSHLEIMEWGLHIHPDFLLKTLLERIRDLQDQVKAIMLGYGRCQALDRLPRDFKIPIFYPSADDCIGILLGQDRCVEELQKEAGTWFLTPGWTEMGMEFIFHELQIHEIGGKSTDPFKLAQRMLKEYTRALFIKMKIGEDSDKLQKKARNIASDFNLRLEKTEGSLSLLENTLNRALRMTCCRQS